MFDFLDAAGRAPDKQFCFSPEGAYSPYGTCFLFTAILPGVTGHVFLSFPPMRLYRRKILVKSLGGGGGGGLCMLLWRGQR